MIRASKMADYAMMLLGQIAAHQAQCMSAHELSSVTGLPDPTVGKVLGRLGRTGLLDSRRDARGCYALARPAREITATDIVAAMDGPVAMTLCIEQGDTACELAQACPSRLGWHRVNAAIRGALDGVTLADIAAPGPSPVARQTERLLEREAEGRA